MKLKRGAQATFVVILGLALGLSACGGGSSNATSNGGGGDSFNSAALQKTLDVVKQKLGANAQLFSVDITSAGISYDYDAGGGQSDGLFFDNGSTDPHQVSDTAGSGGTFPLSLVDSSVVDKLVALKPVGAGHPSPDALSLDVSPAFGNGSSGAPGWNLSGKIGGQHYVILAQPDGSYPTTPGGMPQFADVQTGSAVPPTGASTPTGQVDQALQGAKHGAVAGQEAVKNAQGLVACVTAAQGDPAKVQQCEAQFTP
jgi:hypothetical protein